MSRQQVRSEFLNKLNEHVKGLVDDYKIKEVYIFSSPEGIKTLEEEFPPRVSTFIEKAYKGNYIRYKPDELVRIDGKEKRLASPSDKGRSQENSGSDEEDV